MDRQLGNGEFDSGSDREIYSTPLAYSDICLPNDMIMMMIMICLPHSIQIHAMIGKESPWYNNCGFARRTLGWRAAGQVRWAKKKEDNLWDTLETHFWIKSHEAY